MVLLKLSLVTTVCVLIAWQPGSVAAGSAPSSACQQQLGAFQSCFGTKVRSFVYNTTLTSSRQRSVYQCFASNGCKVPTLITNPNVAKMTKSGTSQYTQQLNCLQRGLGEAKRQMQACMSSVMPNFSFGVTSGVSKISSGDMNVLLENFMTVREAIGEGSICPPEKQAPVQECINTIWKKNEPQRRLWEQKICDIRHSCESGISKECRSTFKKAMSRFQKCTSLKELNIKAIKQVIDSCRTKPAKSVNKKHLTSLLMSVADTLKKEVQAYRKMCPIK